MRVLFTLTAARGSLAPLLPVAGALRDAGHEVAFCTAESCRDHVEAAGHQLFAAGVDYHASDPSYPKNLCGPAGLVFPKVSGLERLAWAVEHLFIGVVGRSMLPDVIDIARRWQADLIVRESLEYSGCAAAEALGLPHASVAAAANCALDQRSFLAGALAPLRQDAGLAADPNADMPYRHLHLCFSPPSLEGPDATFPATARFFRHPFEPGGALPAWAQTNGDRPAVLVSMGTIFHRTPEVYEAVLGGLGDEGLDLWVALGFDQDPARLGLLGDHVHVEPFLPITTLLPRSTLFVTHGGFNSTKEAISAGVPMVVIPLASDQFHSARRCEEVGIGIAIGPDERTPEAIRKAARAVLDDPAYRERAQSLQAEMRALPPVEDAVPLLEALVSPGRA